MGAAQFIVEILTGIWLVKQVPMDWIKDAFASFNAERFAIVAQIVLSIIVFGIGFAVGVVVFWFCIIYLFIRMLAKK